DRPARLAAAEPQRGRARRGALDDAEGLEVVLQRALPVAGGTPTQDADAALQRPGVALRQRIEHRVGTLEPLPVVAGQQPLAAEPLEGRLELRVLGEGRGRPGAG